MEKHRLNIAEIPDMFLMFLGAIVPLASLACLMPWPCDPVEKNKEKTICIAVKHRWSCSSMYLTVIVLLCDNKIN